MSKTLKNKDFIKAPKEEKRKIILEYVSNIYKNEKRFVSKREIRKVFHVEIYNYFDNVFYMYKKRGIEVPLCFCPKEYAIKRIIEFVKEKSKEEAYPTYKEIEVNLGISIRSYFKSIKEVYHKSNINFRLYQERAYNLSYTLNSDEHNKSNIIKIINLIRDKTKKGFYPGVPQIQKELKLAFYKYFNSIQEAYERAGIKYQRISPIVLGKNKERILTGIVILLLRKMKYKIERVSIFDNKFFNKGEDIRAIDANGEEVLIELKAYRKDYNIIKREINQLCSYLIEQRISGGIFITTSNKVNYNSPKIEIINGFKLISLLKQYGLQKFIKQVIWVQEERTNLHERIAFTELKRKEIIYFIINFKGIPTIKQIESNLFLDMRSYFKDVHNFDYLIKEIKNKFNNGNRQLCMDHQQKLQYNLPVS
jgi:hypothetical protein